MHKPGIVLDTSILVSALRSRRGALFRLLSLVGADLFQVSVSVPLVLEYEDALKRLGDETAWTTTDIDDLLDYICAEANRQRISYLWRPFLRDPKDDMVLEVAVAGTCDFIVTYNKADFKGSERFGLRVATAKEFLQEIGVLP